MTQEKEIWLKEAIKKLELLLEFEEDFFVPDAKTLKAFLSKDTLILKMMYKDNPDLLSEAIERLEKVKNSKDPLNRISEMELEELNKSYLQGLTPSQAAINQVKWCETPEEAGEFLVSPSPMPLSLLLLFCFIAAMFATAINLYLSAEALK